MDKLSEYFQTRQFTDKALDRYLRFSNERRWYVGGQFGKLRLYDEADRAFAPGVPIETALPLFCSVYDSVRQWPGVQRKGSLAPADEVFAAILKYGGNTSDAIKINLANLVFPSAETNQVKQELLPAPGFVKPTSDYPWMPVSKVLHFVNPSLFPIWDWDVLWHKVMWGQSGFGKAAFRGEYETFCDEHRFKGGENGSVFLLNYTLWAAQYIQHADYTFMEWFSEWLHHNFSSDLVRYNMSGKTLALYATAFEFVAIGAAYLELGI